MVLRVAQRAAERFIGVDHLLRPCVALLDRRGPDERLERRAGLERIGDTAIAADIGMRGAHLVGIERRVVRHGDDLAGVRIHDHHLTGPGAELAAGFGQLRLGDRLNGDVDAQADRPAIPGLFVSGDVQLHRPLTGIAEVAELARRAGEGAVEDALDTLEAVPLLPDEADDVSADRALRVLPFEPEIGVEARQPLPLHILHAADVARAGGLRRTGSRSLGADRFELEPLLIIELLIDDDVPFVSQIMQTLADFCRIVAQGVAEEFGEGARVGHAPGIDVKAMGDAGGGEDAAFAIGDGAAPAHERGGVVLRTDERLNLRRRAGLKMSHPADEADHGEGDHRGHHAADDQHAGSGGSSGSGSGRSRGGENGGFFLEGGCRWSAPAAAPASGRCVRKHGGGARLLELHGRLGSGLVLRGFVLRRLFARLDDRRFLRLGLGLNQRFKQRSGSRLPGRER